VERGQRFVIIASVGSAADVGGHVRLVKALIVSVAGGSRAAQQRSAPHVNERVQGARAARLGALDPLVDLSVVIVNWNTKDLLRDCLTSILHHAQAIRIEILIVDNGSRDGSVEMVGRDFPTVQVVVNSHNEGFAAANNRGLRRAGGRYFLLLNSDTVVLPDALEAMVRYMDAHPHVGALGPRLLNEDGSLQVSVRDFPRLDHDAAMMLEVKYWPLLGDLARRYMQRTYAPDPEQVREVDWVVGAALLLRREALEQVGLLDDEYFFFFEEVDLCYRLRQHNWPIVYLGAVAIVHLGGQSWARVSAQRLTWYYRGLLRFYRLHAVRRRYLLLRAGIALGAAGHIVWLLLSGRRASNTRALLAAYGRILAYAAGG